MRPAQKPSSPIGVKLERKILSVALACTCGTAAEAKAEASSRTWLRIPLSAAIRSYLFCGRIGSPVPPFAAMQVRALAPAGTPKPTT